MWVSFGLKITLEISISLFSPKISKIAPYASVNETEIRSTERSLLASSFALSNPSLNPLMTVSKLIPLSVWVCGSKNISEYYKIVKDSLDNLIEKLLAQKDKEIQQLTNKNSELVKYNEELLNKLDEYLELINKQKVKRNNQKTFQPYK